MDQTQVKKRRGRPPGSKTKKAQGADNVLEQTKAPRRKKNPDVGHKVPLFEGLRVGDVPARSARSPDGTSLDPAADTHLDKALDRLRLSSKQLRGMNHADVDYSEALLRVMTELSEVREACAVAGRSSPIPFTYVRRFLPNDLPPLLPAPDTATHGALRRWAGKPEPRQPMEGVLRDHPLIEGLLASGYSGALNGSDRAIRYRLSEVTGFRWPLRLIRDWLQRKRQISVDEAHLLSYSLRLRIEHLNASGETEGRSGFTLACLSADRLTSHIRAAELLPEIANGCGYDAIQTAPLLARVRIALMFRDGLSEPPADSEVEQKLRYQLGPRFSDLAFWSQPGTELPQNVAERLAGICGVEVCWLRGTALSAHGSIVTGTEV